MILYCMYRLCVLQVLLYVSVCYIKDSHTVAYYNAATPTPPSKLFLLSTPHAKSKWLNGSNKDCLPSQLGSISADFMITFDKIKHKIILHNLVSMSSARLCLAEISAQQKELLCALRINVYDL